jgi:hypothetical protein
MRFNNVHAVTTLLDAYPCAATELTADESGGLFGIRSGLPHQLRWGRGNGIFRFRDCAAQGRQSVASRDDASGERHTYGGSCL